MRQLIPLPLLAMILLAGAAFAKEPEKKDGVTHVDAKGAAKVITSARDEKKPVTILDIRTPEEFKGGHLADARNIDFMSDDFEKKVAKLDREKPYVVY